MTTITVAEAEAVARACVTATDAAHVCKSKALDAFHAAWRVLVEAGQATFGDWSASFYRALGRGPYHEEAERSGWCMVHPDRAIGIERWCMRCEIGKTATCGLVGCPGPAPKAEPAHVTRLAYYPPADEAEIDEKGRVVPVMLSPLTVSEMQAAHDAHRKAADLVVGGYVTTADGLVGRVLEIDRQRNAAMIDDGNEDIMAERWDTIESLTPHPHGGIAYTDAEILESATQPDPKPPGVGEE